MDVTKEFIPNSHIVRGHSQVTGFNTSPDTFENSNDIRLLDKCLNTSARYKVPEHIRDRMVSRLVNIMDTNQLHKHQLKAIQTLVKLDEVNIKILSIMKPKRSEQTITNVSKLSDAELLEAIKTVHKLLPPVIDQE